VDEIYFKRSDNEDYEMIPDCQETSHETPAYYSDYLGEHACIDSNDKKYRLELFMSKADFKNKTVRLGVYLYKIAPEGSVPEKPFDWAEFSITPFDFPLTDNTQIDPTHRFALSLYKMDEETTELEFRIIWFPEGYFTERERPFDINSVRKTLNLDS